MDILGRGTFSVVRAVDAGGQALAAKQAHTSVHGNTLRTELSLATEVAARGGGLPVLSANLTPSALNTLTPRVAATPFTSLVRTGTIEDARRYMRSLLVDLDVAAAAGIVHRDVKPKNFLFDKDVGVGWLTDWGLAETEETLVLKAARRIASAVSVGATARPAPAMSRRSRAMTPEEVPPEGVRSLTPLPVPPRMDIVSASVNVPGADGVFLRDALAARTTRAPAPPWVTQASVAESGMSDGKGVTGRAAADAILSLLRQSGFVFSEEGAAPPSALFLAPLDAGPAPPCLPSSDTPMMMSDGPRGESSDPMPQFQPLATVGASAVVAAHATMKSAPKTVRRAEGGGGGAPVARGVEGGSVGLSATAGGAGVAALLRGSKRGAEIAARAAAQQAQQQRAAKAAGAPTTGANAATPLVPTASPSAAPRSILGGGAAAAVRVSRSQLGVVGRGNGRALQPPPRAADAVDQVADRAGTPGFRPPEVLFASHHQGPPVDAWAAGVILLSLLARRYPLFPGRSDEDHALSITLLMRDSLRAAAGASLGKDVLEVPLMGQLVYAPSMAAGLRSLVGLRRQEERGFEDALHLAMCLLDPDPARRMTPRDALLHHPFFKAL